MSEASRAEHINAGVDSKSVVREALIEMRDRLFSGWPDTIGDTLIATHAIWWLSQNLEGQNEPHSLKDQCRSLIILLEHAERILEGTRDSGKAARVGAACAALQALVEVL